MLRFNFSHWWIIFVNISERIPELKTTEGELGSSGSENEIVSCLISQNAKIDP